MDEPIPTPIETAADKVFAPKPNLGTTWGPVNLSAPETTKPKLVGKIPMVIALVALAASIWSIATKEPVGDLRGANTTNTQTIAEIRNALGELFRNDVIIVNTLTQIQARVDGLTTNAPGVEIERVR